MKELFKSPGFQAWFWGNVAILAIVGTANLAIYSASGHTLKIVHEWHPALTAEQIRAAQYIMDHKIADMSDLPANGENGQTVSKEPITKRRG